MEAVDLWPAIRRALDRPQTQRWRAVPAWRVFIGEVVRAPLAYGAAAALVAGFLVGQILLRPPEATPAATEDVYADASILSVPADATSELYFRVPENGATTEEP
jgi:hypothetical protein